MWAWKTGTSRRSMYSSSFHFFRHALEHETCVDQRLIETLPRDRGRRQRRVREVDDRLPQLPHDRLARLIQRLLGVVVVGLEQISDGRGPLALVLLDHAPEERSRRLAARWGTEFVYSSHHWKGCPIWVGCAFWKANLEGGRVLDGTRKVVKLLLDLVATVNLGHS